ncbi:hypothetical protein B0H19DRAFT_1167059 [Mycena capillaripes]|nr:hypothetical protein B0H19DRAFT_1167059 [Mycena capillaripes]
MAASVVLHIQELCEEVTSFLRAPSDLQSCALVSRACAVAAQRQLFADIDVPPHDSRACKSLFAAFKISPHLVSFIRRLRVRLEQNVLRQLLELKMPNLKELSIHGRASGSRIAKPVVIHTAANLLSLPTICCVTLASLNFREMHDLDTLFERCTTQLDSLTLDKVDVSSNPWGLPVRARRTKINTLRIRTPDWDRVRWLLDAQCPLDLTALHTVDCDTAYLFYGGFALLTSPRLTVKNVILSTLDWGHGGRRPLLVLGSLPSLTHLTFTTSADFMVKKWSVLAATFESNFLVHLVLKISAASSVTQTAMALKNLTSLFTRRAFPSLQSVELNISSDVWSRAIRERVARATLADWELSDKLRIVQLY